ncbi:hypothetical protein BegalDRAFT_0812 [Beggiatoa alba B18LD]|uniref:Uncharacterized protein n=1 Tax=Beggiatoa alba B18LD TaxID=395493 RepID=I3CDN0_9GAMM|nr:hypothetical protein [Beggiatoa alba]EIJ41723.1 hypothetical protein BegalDRAFT_0812 [Beggiatoa alba B18LD]
MMLLCLLARKQHPIMKRTALKHILKKHSVQTGVVLLLTLLITVVSSVSFFLTQFNAVDTRLIRQQQTEKALQYAKQALLGYAARYYDFSQPPFTNPDGRGRFGFLPCPDTGVSIEGREAGNCGIKNQSAIGKLPWLTLAIPPLFDESNECLWYAVSGSYKNSSGARTDMLNDDNAGFFEVTTASRATGSHPDERAVAVIIAPHLVQTGQTRPSRTATETCGSNYNFRDYIESVVENSTASPPHTFAKINNVNVAYKIEVFNESGNDQIIYITRKELFDFINKRKDFKQLMHCYTQLLAHCVAIPARQQVVADPVANDKRLSFAASVALSDYENDGSYVELADTLVGRLPNTLTLPLGNPAIINLITACSISDIITSDLDTTCQNTAIDTSDFTKFSRLWQNKKSQLFYEVAENYKRTAVLPIIPCDGSSSCVDGIYIAKITFAGSQLSGQTRTASPLDTTETRHDINNYLIGTVETASDTNDISYCIKEDLTVEHCTP